MGTIKDLVDLTTSLVGRVKDRKLAAELREIQGMIGSLQSDQAELHDRNMQLMVDNAQLRKTIASLEAPVANKDEASPCSEDKLPDEAERMLVFIASTRDGVTQDDIIHRSGEVDPISGTV